MTKPLNQPNFLPFLYDAYGMVKVFHETFELPIRRNWADSTYTGRVLRANLIEEEFKELTEATDDIGRLDAYGDLLYVLLGTFLELGYQDNRLAEVNYRKIPPYPGQVATVITNLKSKTPCFRRLGWGLPDATAGVAKTAWTYFPKFPLAFKAIHESNMTKLWEVKSADPTHTSKLLSSGKYLVKRPDGKVIKSPTYKPVDLKPFLS